MTILKRLIHSLFASSVDDPTHSTDTVVDQNYQEDNTFSVATATPSGQDAMWDFSLVDYNAPASTPYCFRAVSSSGSPLYGYTVVPELTTSSSALKQVAYRAYENQDTQANFGAIAWGGSSADFGRSVVQTSDGGYAITGTTQSYGAGGYDMFLAKYDSAGNLTWSNTWGGSASDTGYSLVQTSDGGYAVAGGTGSFGTGYETIFLAKYDSTGTLSWSRISSGASSGGRAYSIIQTSDGGYAITGAAGAINNSDMFLAKYDSTGSISWSSVYGSSASLANEYGRSLVQTSDGGYVVTGSDNGDILLVKYNSSGSLSWDRIISTTGSDKGLSIIQTSDGGYAVTGSTTRYGAGSDDMFLVTFDNAGTLNWFRTWGGSSSDIGNSLVQTTDGGYAVSGQTSSYGAGSIDMFLAKYDSTGTLGWSKTWGGSSSDIGNSLVQTTDGGYAVTGQTSSYGAGSSDMFLAKYDSAGTMLGCTSNVCKDYTPSTSSQNLSTITSTSPYGSGSFSNTSPVVTTKSDTVGGGSDYTSISTMIVSPPVTFAKTWGGSGADSGYSLVQTSDGGYAVTGSTLHYGAGNGDVFLAKYDSAGTLSWSRTWGASGGSDYGYSLVQTSDGGYAVTGAANFGGAIANYNMFLAKFDSVGTLSWSRTWGGLAEDYGYSLVQTSDGGYAVTGETASYGAGSNDAFLAKYDSSGTLSWSRTWGGTGSDDGDSLIQTSDGGYIVSGSTSSYGAGSSDMFLAKYDSAGTLSWSRTWGGTGSDYGKDVVQTSDGGYAITAQTTSYGAGSSDMFLAKYDSAGTLSWSRTWGGTASDVGRSLVQTSDGGYVIVGETSSFLGLIQTFLAKYDSAGTLSWSRTWGGLGNDYGKDVVQTSDGGYAVSGESNGYTADYEMFLAKFDNYGDIAGCTTDCKSPAVPRNSPAATTSSPAATTSSPAATTSSPAAAVTSPSVTDNAVFATTLVRQIKNASALDAQDTSAELYKVNDTFRLRIAIAAENKSYTSQGTFKLQSAVYAGTCDPAAATYTDVSSSTAIGFFDNLTNNTADKIRADATDPSYTRSPIGTYGKVMQTYVESNSFVNPRQAYANNEMIWDFSLKSDGSKIGRTFCFRVVETGNTLTGGYDQYAKVYVPPQMKDVMRHGAFFNRQDVQQPFAWGRE